MEEKQLTPLQFVPFSGSLDPGFWHQLTRLKLEFYRLDDDPVNIAGYYCNYDSDGLIPHLDVSYNALDEFFRTPNRCFKCHGRMKNTNTLEAFKDFDKKAFLDGQGLQIWEDITSGRAIEDPSLLSKFMLLTYAELKKYHYYSWFAFTAICFPTKLNLKSEVVSISKRFSDGQISSLLSNFDKLSTEQSLPAFLVREVNETLEVGSLKDFKTMTQDGCKILIGFCDPSTLGTHPGWPLRNLLALAAYHWGAELKNDVEVICLRDRFKDDSRQVLHSIVLHISLPSLNISEVPKFVGWEKNEHQKLGPRMVNLSASMDPARLAESAVDLNLKLMRWRLLPDLDLDLITRTKCLLLGSGTLGCNVARCLLGWGVRNITFVDNSTISYSNPVRQSLFVFEDCLNGGRPKAEAAAESLKRIFPGVNSVGVNLSIPMPGHPIPDNLVDQVRKEVAILEQLVEDHDVVFLLMDTRESRWLPTVIGKSKCKIVMSAALGFDTYLVVRHGVRTKQPVVDDAPVEEAIGGFSKEIPGNQLGCYFCNDVVAPGDSTHDRTLDQQCTVSRPGVSVITAAAAVELLVSVLVHPLQGLVAADTSSKDDHFTKDSSSILGLVPHQGFSDRYGNSMEILADLHGDSRGSQVIVTFFLELRSRKTIRGFLSRFCNILPSSQAFDKCTACSSKVLDAYERDGFDFLLNVFNTPRYLEDLTGLTELYAESEIAELWDFSDDEAESSPPNDV